ncbi:hypothetical protein [Streptomyces sp. NPDC001315]|uniref:hypothetical protein n=1 Tax=Streptomyces sp. NPDC001315 TaxID=3364562 RepID=UPI003677CCDB
MVSTLASYRFTQPESINGVSQSGADAVSAFSGVRSVSPTNSIRFSVRTAGSTCVESVRCRPPVRSSPGLRQPGQHHLQDLLLQPVGDQAGAEVTQDCEVGASQVDIVGHSL